jgi:integrase
MAKFASPIKQAVSIMKQIQGTDIKSIGTVRNYQSALTRVAEYLQNNRIGSLRALDKIAAETYLQNRSSQVGQSQLNMERQAMQKMMLVVTNKLDVNEKLKVVKSEKISILRGRSYTLLQVEMICNAQREKNSLSTKIVLDSGIRSHELYTLLPANVRKADIRPSSIAKFDGREGIKYTVVGKGGLVREVMMSYSLSLQLETKRLSYPRVVDDRGIKYQQHYDINAGARWSNSFSHASKKILGHSNGGHGLRHTYAQNRMDELTKLGYSRQQALEIVSQELGHFRPEITEIYLR